MLKACTCIYANSYLTVSKPYHPYFHASLPPCYVLLRFTCGTASADLLMTSMEAGPFLINIFVNVQALEGSEPAI